MTGGRRKLIFAREGMSNFPTKAIFIAEIKNCCGKFSRAIGKMEN
jgi:hypothetical protein